jgi:hypothetical protein
MISTAVTRISAMGGGAKALKLIKAQVLRFRLVQIY